MLKWRERSSITFSLSSYKFDVLIQISLVPERGGKRSFIWGRPLDIFKITWVAYFSICYKIKYLKVKFGPSWLVQWIGRRPVD